MDLRREIIGDCLLINGDSLMEMPTLGKVNHIITDPPYESSLHKSKNSLTGRIRLDGGPQLKGLNFDSIDEIREPYIFLSENICQGWFIAFCTIEGVAKWADCINASSMKYKRACIWVKPDSTPQLNGQGPAQGAECFVTAWNGEGHAKWNAGGKRGVYTHLTNDKNRSGLHPTEKPVPLMMEILRDFTNPGEVILDPFMGSGTTLVACAKMGRKAIGIEINPQYYDLACKRVRDAYEQGDMFIESPKQKQERFI